MTLSVAVDQFEDFGDHLPASLDDLLGEWQGRGIDRLFITTYAPFAFLPRLADAAARLGLTERAPGT